MSAPRTRIALPAALAAALALAIAGCGSGGGSSSASSSGGGYSYGNSAQPRYGSDTAGAQSSQGGGAGVVAVADNPKLGRIVVDAKGFTLYDFRKDKGGKSACDGACAKAWPPLLSSGAPVAKGGAEASKLGTTKRNDGTTQVTYADHPLYTYVADRKPGEARGDDVTSFGAQWYALTPAGEEAGD
ncbi:MAG: hypothetical protein U0R52_05570 [Solirubrobacterales bacterium]